ncbi:Hypothetical_protein [Hexamita inflata]|uniref:Hypothetical_protein n=1 Tax=Hexamita inflata TaxID=28002 RepID=A0AA86UU05_9EUKA|nr:Hypothetical protein HINF_LOCUS55529 [Hexamita inflata]
MFWNRSESQLTAANGILFQMIKSEFTMIFTTAFWSCLIYALQDPILANIQISYVEAEQEIYLFSIQFNLLNKSILNTETASCTMVFVFVKTSLKEAEEARNASSQLLTSLHGKVSEMSPVKVSEVEQVYVKDPKSSQIVYGDPINVWHTLQSSVSYVSIFPVKVSYLDYLDNTTSVLSSKQFNYVEKIIRFILGAVFIIMYLQYIFIIILI